MSRGAAGAGDATPLAVRAAWARLAIWKINQRLRARIAEGGADAPSALLAHARALGVPLGGARTFRRFFGCSPGEFVRTARLEHAAERLRGSEVGGQDPRETVRRWLSPEFEATRRLLLELHLAADVRNPDTVAVVADTAHDAAEEVADAAGIQISEP